VVDRASLFLASFPVIETFVPTDDRPVGHLALAVTDLAPMRARADTLGLDMVAEPALAPEGFRSFFVRAPDRVLLEIVGAGPL
jgi:catechol 2,3-dioxygenase-like lactoylglutathione lyase family enzyme